jgi:hypothetical protein
MILLKKLTQQTLLNSNKITTKLYWTKKSPHSAFSIISPDYEMINNYV